MAYAEVSRLNQFFEASDSASDQAKEFALEAASRLFDRLAKRDAEYFADTEVFSSVPADVELATIQLAIAILRQSDAAAGVLVGVDGRTVQLNQVSEMVRTVAESYEPVGETQVEQITTTLGWF